MRINEKRFYLDNGFVDIDYILSLGFTFTAIVGGRGTGKTYGILQYMIEHGEKFLHVRRTKTQQELIGRESKNNFKKLNQVRHWEIHPVKGEGSASEYYQCEQIDGKWIPSGEVLGETAALSTTYNLRGVADDDSFKWIFYDEFIPLKGERPIKDEFGAFWQLYENYNRNRELEGKPAMRCVMAANANLLNNPMFAGLGIVNKILKAQQKRTLHYMAFPDRHFLVVFLRDSPISERKRHTALSQLLEGNVDSSYIDNEFKVDDTRFICSVPLRELVPVAVLGAVCIYKHKSEHFYYITPHKSGTPPEYPDTDTVRFFRKYYKVYDAYVSYRCKFSDYLTKSIFEEYIKR